MERLLENWARFVARWPLLVIGAWIVLVLGALHWGPSISAVAAQHTVAALPASAPSMRAEHLYEAQFAAGQQAANSENDVIVLADSHGIGPSDIALAEQLEAWLTNPATRPAHLKSVAGPGPSAPATAFESRDGQALRLVVTWDTANAFTLQSPVGAVETYLDHQPLPAGVSLGITGAAAINADTLSSIFGTTGAGAASAGGLVGLLIILVVLGAVYRSPLAVIAPLVTIGMAFGLALPVIAWLGQTVGLPVATFSLEYVIFVMLGAGTNYGVFMLSRYKEEIRRGKGFGRAERREALARSVGHVGEAITSSAATVVAATAIMGLAQLDLLRVTGPAIAVAVCCLLLAGLTLLPALMALCGRALFWPALPRPGTLATREAPDRGLWARAGQLVTQHPLPVALAALIVLTPLALSVLAITPSFDDLRSLPAAAPSVRAFEVYQRHFPDATQIGVLVSDPEHDLRQPTYASALSGMAAAFSQIPHVTGVQAPVANSGAANSGQAATFSIDGRAAQFILTLNADPNSQTARDVVDAAYAAAARSQRGTSLADATVLIRGTSAQVRDEAVQLSADMELVIALVCLTVYVILALLVRSVTAPIYLLGTIALSAGTAIGLTNLVYHGWLGQPLFYIVPVFAFVFLVALGEDFNILTMSRIREEVGRLGHRRGIAAAVALTGGVVSSCGLVMAASFTRAINNSLVEVSELGFAVVSGVLLDTFIVRPLLVPALATMLGRWNWVWPGKRMQQQGDEMRMPPSDAREAASAGR